MTIFDRIKLLAEAQGKNLQTVAKDLGFSENYIYGLKNKKSPSAEHLAKIADYFHTSVDYLMERNDRPYTEQDLKPFVKHAMLFDGRPVSEADRNFLLGFMQMYFDKKSSDEISLSRGD